MILIGHIKMVDDVAMENPLPESPERAVACLRVHIAANYKVVIASEERVVMQRDERFLAFVGTKVEMSSVYDYAQVQLAKLARHA